MSKHSDLTSESIHSPFRWVWNDNTAKTAETAIDVDQISKIGLLLDNGSGNSELYVLIDITPTWALIGGSALGLIESGVGTDFIILNGSTNSADGGFSLAMGEECSASGVGAFGIGSGNLADGNQSVSLGKESNARLQSQLAISSGSIDAEGDNQTSFYQLKRTVTHSDANWYELYFDDASEQLTIPADSLFTFIILISGVTSGVTKAFSFKIEGAIRNAGGTTTLLASTVTTIYDTDDVSFDARVTANDTTDALAIEVQDSDAASDLVYWSGTVMVSEVAQS